MRVVLADDSFLVRAGVEALFETFPNIDLVSVCSSLEELLDAVATAAPDVVLTDIRMPPTYRDEGIQAAVALRRSHPHVGVVVLSHYLVASQALELVQDGSRGRGYLLKDRLAHPDQLLDAVRAVAAGGSFIDPLVVDALVAVRGGASGTELRRLTARELELLGHVASGKSNAAISACLGVTDRTVEKHINSIFSKLGLSNAADVHRRVASVLMYLSQAQAQGGSATTDDGWRSV